jgi:YD repeat-containing protein
MSRTAITILLIAMIFALPLLVEAQKGGLTRYIYDANGRLHAVLSPNGEATVYEYDAAGNFTAIRPLTSNQLEILDFTPREGVPGDLVTFYGVGFGGGVSSVSFNGANAQIVSFDQTTVVAIVPPVATTGIVTITTPSGSATTEPNPFTIRGIRVSPANPGVISGETIQFTASLVIIGNQSVRWSVNGVEGGSSAAGTISNTGLYTAPNLPPSLPSQIFVIRTTSLAVPQVFGETRVTVRNPLFIRQVISGGVTVQLNESTQLPQQSVISKGVTATKGPNILTIMPNSIAVGTAVTVTISGINLNGTTALRFIKADGTVDAAITLSNLMVNADGTRLMATVTVGGNAAAGIRVVEITALAGSSQLANVGTNTIQITTAGSKTKRDKNK